MGNPRCRIIYTHPAGKDGFSYFYIAYLPGQRGISLKFKRQSEDVPMDMTMEVHEMVTLLARKRTSPGPDWPYEVTDRALRILKGQIIRWQEQAAGF